MVAPLCLWAVSGACCLGIWSSPSLTPTCISAFPPRLHYPQSLCPLIGSTAHMSQVCPGCFCWHNFIYAIFTDLSLFFSYQNYIQPWSPSIQWGHFWPPLAQNVFSFHWVLIALTIWATNLVLNSFWLTLCSSSFHGHVALSPHPYGLCQVSGSLRPCQH